MQDRTLSRISFGSAMAILITGFLIIFQSTPTIAQRSLNEAQLLTPYEQANLHNSSETANVDILTTVLTPVATPSLFRIMVASDTAAIFKARITKATNTQTVIFNDNVDLTADCVYIFDLLVHSGDTVNFQFDTTNKVTIFRVQEIKAGAQ